MPRALTRQTDLRTAARDARIATLERRLNGWTNRLFASVLGDLQANRARPDIAIANARRRFVNGWSEGPAAIEMGLRSLLDWSYSSGADMVMTTVPLAVWRHRYEAHAVRTEGRLREVTYFHGRIAIKDLLNGKLTRDQAKQVIRHLEFPPPTEREVRDILTDTTAPDRIPWEHRIKTVPAAKLDRLLGTIASGIAQGENIDQLEKPLRAFFSDENYKARRIARTESVRVAEAGLRESWEQVGDLVMAIQTWTAGDANVRDEHQHWHGKLFKRRASGEYVADDGERLPTFPAGPNCRCYSTPVMDFEQRQAPPAPLPGPAPTLTPRPEPPPQPTPVPEPAPEPRKYRYQPARTVREAQSLAASLGVAKRADYGGISLEVANETNRVLEKYVVRHPWIREGLNFVGNLATADKERAEAILQAERARYEQFGFPRGTMKSLLAARRQSLEHETERQSKRAILRFTASGSHSGLAINPTWFGSRELAGAEKQLQQMARKGWFPPGTGSLKGRLDHEMLHGIDNVLRLTDPRTGEILDDGLARIVGSLLPTRMDVKEQVSKEAGRSQREMIAEAWTEYTNSGNPRTAARQIGAYIEKRMTEHERRLQQ